MIHYLFLVKQCCTVTFSLLLLLLCSSKAGAQPQKDTSNAQHNIATLTQQMEEAFNSNNMIAVAAFYADDGEIVYPNSTIKGRTRLNQYWLALKDRGRGWKLTTVEIGGDGELLYQLGNSDLTYIHKGKETKASTNFVLLWRKQSDGTYKIFRDYLTRTKFVRD